MNYRKDKVVLFDIDGTILNLRAGIAYDIFTETSKEVFGIEISADKLPSFHGKTDLQILEDIFVEFSAEHFIGNFDVDNLWSLLHRKFLKAITPETVNILPGISELIDMLAENNYALGLVTGNFKQNAYLKLSVARLDKHFTFGGFGCDDKDRNKLPIIALERAGSANIINNNYDNKKVMIIGDTFRDIACGKANGIAVLAVATGGSSVEELEQYSPELIYEDLSDAKEIFQRIDNYLS